MIANPDSVIANIPGLADFIASETAEEEEVTEEQEVPTEQPETEEEAPEETEEESLEEEAPSKSEAELALEAELAEERARNRELAQQLSNVQMNFQRPQIVKFEDLNEEMQSVIQAKADEYGVEPQVLLMQYHREQVAQYESGYTSQVLTAEQQVTEAYKSDPRAAKFGNQVMEVLRQDPVARHLDNLRLSNPTAWAASAVALVRATYDKLEAAQLAKGRNATIQQKMKAATRGEMSRASAPQTTPKPKAGEELTKAVLQAGREAQSLFSLFRTSK